MKHKTKTIVFIVTVIATIGTLYATVGKNKNCHFNSDNWSNYHCSPKDSLQ